LRRVVITGIGLISPVGNDVPSAWANLVTGVSGVGPITLFDASQFRVRIAAEVKDFDAVERFGTRESRHLDRFTQFALTAAREAVASSGLEICDQNRGRIGIVIGTGIGGITTLSEQMSILATRGPDRVSPHGVPNLLADSAPGLLAISLGVRGPNMAITTACASGANAIGEAAEMIRRGAADVMLAGGSEAAVIPYIVASFRIMRAISTRNEDPARASRPFDAQRDGFVIGEGAAILVLEALEHAQSRAAEPLAELAGYAVTNDAHHITAPPEKGTPAVECMRLALLAANLEPGNIDYINAHGTSTPLNDASETNAIKQVYAERAYEIPISSTKSMTGHMLGAAGAVEAAVSVMVLREGVVPPTINYDHPDPVCDLNFVPNRALRANVTHVMSNSFGFGGHNATLVLSRFR
jgi:3-oxoacyl-[acyl-carrier-protein] synthase II